MKTIKYVEQQGDNIERNRLKCILVGKPVKNDILDELIKMQNPDGGFSYWVKEFSTVFDTVYILSWLDDLQLRSGKIVDDAFDFLISMQREDSGWDEVEYVKDLDSPSFIPGKIDTRVFLTAYCAHWFIRFGRAEPPGAKGCPVDFIKEFRNPNGLILDDLQATWDSLVLFSYHPGQDSELFKEAYEIIEKKFAPDNQKGSNIAYLLCCLRDAKLPIENPFVNLCIDELIQKQQENGFWESEYGEEYTVGATIEALRVLKYYKVV